VVEDDSDEQPVSTTSTIKVAHYKGTMVAVKVVNNVVSTFTTIDELEMTAVLPMFSCLIVEAYI